MKNYEKYADEIKGCDGSNFCRDFVKPRILKSRSCANTSCDQCKMLQIIWLMEEYEEPEVDWSEVEVDTPILVKNSEDEEWRKRHFAKYKNGNVYAWSDGLTSWTAYDKMVWKYAKLAENEKECKESKVDWSKVEVDTPILVRDGENNEWQRSYFAKYEDGFVYTWIAGATSWTAKGNMYKWRFAKLAESEDKCEKTNKKKPEVDWSEVEVDTPILVRDAKYRRWVKRYFAKYNNGTIFAWTIGCTSRDAHNMMTPWKYAKLAENEETK